MSEEFFLDRMVREYPGASQATLRRIYPRWRRLEVLRGMPWATAKMIAYEEAQISLTGGRRQGSD